LLRCRVLHLPVDPFIIVSLLSLTLEIVLR
jgi:hypothetical protein